MKKYKKSKRYYYYRKQKLYGVALIAIGLFMTILDGGNIAGLLLLAPLGLGVIFTKDRIIMDDYYWEMEAKKFDQWKEP